MSQYLRHFPKPLLDDLVMGRWLPVIGAGMSHNAIVASGHPMPLWDDLGRQLAAELPDYPYIGALDAVSAYAHEYGRPRMIERVAEALFIGEARPGDSHRAFCSILFDIVCTTNVDFLLEQQYEATARYCRPIVDEDHLVVNARSTTTALLKLHGDVHHPARLVLTEEDYDVFLDKYPLLATYVANLLITRTAVLVGYSLDDPDFRQLWTWIGQRLGKARRLAYTIMVDAQSTDIARYARRGVKVIGLPGSRKKYSQILAAAFDELREYMQTHIIELSLVTEENPLAEFSLPKEAITRLCFFAVPLALQSQYQDQVFPLAERSGLVPVTAAGVISPGENYSAKVDAIMRRSIAAVVDVTTRNTLLELEMLMAMRRPVNTLVVREEGTALPSDLSNRLFLLRTKRPLANQTALLKSFDKWFRDVAAHMEPQLADEPVRLLRVREYRAAVISAITQLEALLRTALETADGLPDRGYSLRPLAELAARRELLTATEYQRLRAWTSVRNMVVHSQGNVSRAKATEIVQGAMAIGQKLRSRR